MKLIAAGIAVALSGLIGAFWLLPGNAQAGSAQEWPVEIQAPHARIVLYQPQPESLENDKLSARAAVSVTETGATEPVFGAIWFDARVATDRDQRTVTVQEIHVPQVRFPNVSEEQRTELANVLEAELPKLQLEFSLDSLVTSLNEERAEQGSARGLKNDPPRIVYSDVPATLIVVDGTPILQPIEGSSVQRVSNTPFTILFEPSSKTYFLEAGDTWVATTDIHGAWRQATPPSEVLAAVPSEPTSARSSTKPPRIIVATEPSELIVTDGKPALKPYAGNDLLYVTNTENDLFVDVPTNDYYVLFSGRWFKSKSLAQGPWTFVPADELPAAFASIPSNSTHADVRAHVAGTSEARDAVLDATVPQTAAIRRDAPGPNVTYDGDPRFEAIEGTSLRYALNTPYSVIECRGKFYCCEQGVWYIAPAPRGPWSVCTEVPEEIYSIPPSVPVYPVTYCHVYDVYPDVVYCGYLPGYLGCYVWGPTVVWGTGWFYPGWCGAYYFPHPWTWGFCAHYSPWTCSWGFGFSHGWGGSPGWFAFNASWNAHWGEHDGWWGSGGFHAGHADVHSGITRERIANFREHLGDRPRGRDNLYNRGENVARRANVRADAPRASIARRTPNDLFTDRDGNVMRRAPDGAWQERRGTTWMPSDRATRPLPEIPRTRPMSPPPTTRPGVPPSVRPSAPTMRPSAPPAIRPSSPVRPPNTIERDSQARQRGAQRSEQFQRATRGGP